ncbi:MAG: ABC transporter transmembrane domain-containing protein [Methanomassiliicoccaceae archaeon]|nr:ABC transporter transmembrane domain-containing protein [Methanomassiliicoccaceae archaeon]
MNVLRYITKYRLFILVIVVFSVLSTIVSVAVPYLNGMFIDMLIASTDIDEVIRFALIIIAIGLFGVFIAYMNNMAHVKFAGKSSFDLIADTVGYVQKVPYDTFVSRFNPAYLIQRIRVDSNALTSFIINNFVAVFLQAGSFIVIMYIMFTINVQIFIMVLVFIPAYMLCYVVMRNPLYQRNIRLKEDQDHFSKVLFEQVNQMHEIKAEASFAKSLEAENRSFRTYFGSLVNFSRLSYLFTSLDGIIVTIFQAIVLFIGGIQIVNGNMSVGEFVIVTMYFAMLVASVKYYFNLGKAYQEYKASNFRMDDIYSIEKENNGTERLGEVSNIVLDKVTYSYPNQDIPIMKEISAEFNRGDIVLITGKNGSGKSTMMNVVLGILQNIQDGSVKYSGINVSDIDLYSVRNEKMAALLQNSNPPDATVREYLSDHFGLDENGILDMIRIMGLKEMFLGDNFDITNFWDKKMNSLSGGERQKIMLIKALCRNRDVLILDEPSTGLDAQTVDRLTDYLDITKRNRICIIISHDPKFERIANSVINFEKTA